MLAAGLRACAPARLRACADLAEQARARRDHDAARAAQDAAAELASWLERTAGVPFTDHPMVAVIPAARASWDAEQTRLAGSSDPGAWRAAAKTWQSLGWPHRAGYAWWRQAQAQLDAGQRTATESAKGRATRWMLRVTQDEQAGLTDCLLIKTCLRDRAQLVVFTYESGLTSLTSLPTTAQP